MNPLQTILARLFGHRVVSLILSAKTFPRFVANYGEFDFSSCRRFGVHGLQQESGQVHGAVVKFIGCMGPIGGSVLLPGESSSVKVIYARLCGVPVNRIRTTGIMQDMDVHWDFNDPPPDFSEKFSLIVSQSMLEHLVDPYRHIVDCASLLNSGGHLVIHTVMPGFGYHRHPVDCFRFYPDWFEEVAIRLGLEVGHRHIRNSRITYHLIKH